MTLRGERSRYFGADAAAGGDLSGARTNLASDLYFRGVRETRTVEKLLAEPAPVGPSRDVRAMMRGWAAGYNAWLEQREISDPTCAGAPWIRPVTELDVAARGLAIASISGEGRFVDTITAAQPPAGATTASGAPSARTPAAKAVTKAADEMWGAPGMGSNAVAFRGDTTANGRGLLLGNPHYPWEGGRRFWQSQQTIPGELDVSGGSLLGTPVISIGFNAHVAWSHTVSTDIPANFHRLTLDPADPTTYLVDGEAERMTKRTVTVAVKDGAPVTRTQWWTRYGPVVTSLSPQVPLPWTSGTAYALHDPSGAIEDVAAMADRGRLTVRDLQRQQFANRVPAGDLAAEDVARACAALPGGTATGSDGKAVDVSEACGVLKVWDRSMDTGSRGALLFDRFWRKLEQAVPQGRLWKVPFSAADPVRTPNTLDTDAPGFATALADAVTELRGAGIALDAPLGAHQFVVRDGKRLPVPGGAGRLGVWNVIEPTWDPARGGYAKVPFGSSHLQAVGWDGSRCPVARTLLTYSQSSNPESPHFADQTRLFSGENWVTSRFCEKDILSSPKLKVVRVHERR